MINDNIIIDVPYPNPPIDIVAEEWPVLLIDVGAKLDRGPKGDPGPTGPKGDPVPGLYMGHGPPPDDLDVVSGSGYIDLDGEMLLYKKD